MEGGKSSRGGGEKGFKIMVGKAAGIPDGSWVGHSTRTFTLFLILEK